jgi:hypothetical protein
VLALVLALTPLALLALVAPALRVSPLAGIAIAFATATTALVAATARAPHAALSRLRPALATAATGAVLMGLGFALARTAHGAVGAEVAAGLVGTAGVLLLGIGIGALVGGRIAHAGHLTAVALASSAADIWSVHAPEGVTHAIVETPDMAVQRLLTVSAAIPPGRVPDAIIGLGDVLFAALYLAASAKHALPRWRTALGVMAGLLLAGAGTFVARMALPALPFIGACVVLAQPRARAIARKDLLPTLVAAGLVLLSLARVFLRRG